MYKTLYRELKTKLFRKNLGQLARKIKSNKNMLQPNLKNRSKYFKGLENKRINSEIILEGKRIDYFIEKLNNYPYRNYNTIMFNYNNNSNHSDKKKKNNNIKDKIILPMIKRDYSTYSKNSNKNLCKLFITNISM